MFPMECHRLRRSQGHGLAKDPRIGNLRLLEQIAPNFFGLLDGHPIVAFGL